MWRLTSKLEILLRNNTDLYNKSVSEWSITRPFCKKKISKLSLKIFF